MQPEPKFGSLPSKHYQRRNKHVLLAWTTITLSAAERKYSTRERGMFRYDLEDGNFLFMFRRSHNIWPQPCVVAKAYPLSKNMFRQMREWDFWYLIIKNKTTDLDELMLFQMHYLIISMKREGNIESSFKKVFRSLNLSIAWDEIAA